MATALRSRLHFAVCLTRNPRIALCRRYSSKDPDDYSNLKTTVKILNDDKEQGMFFTSFSSLGFRLHTGIHVVGPCAVFPRSILHWNVSGVEDITEESVSLFAVLEPKIDVLILGVGEQGNVSRVNMNTIRFLKEHKVNAEVLSTEQALTTFNFLNSENRNVAGGLIPPAYFDDQPPDTDRHHNILLEESDVADKTGDYFTDSPQAESAVKLRGNEIKKLKTLAELRQSGPHLRLKGKSDDKSKR